HRHRVVQCEPTLQPTSPSHCSSAPMSTAPSPHCDRGAENSFFSLDFFATKLPVSMLQSGIRVALSRPLPVIPEHAAHDTLSVLPRFVSFMRAETGGHALSMDTCAPWITTARLAPSASTSGPDCTRKRPPEHEIFGTGCRALLTGHTETVPTPTRRQRPSPRLNIRTSSTGRRAERRIEFAHCAATGCRTSARDIQRRYAMCQDNSSSMRGFSGIHMTHVVR